MDDGNHGFVSTNYCKIITKILLQAYNPQIE